MTNAHVDLIYIEYTDGRSMACVIARGAACHQSDTVAAKEAIKKIAPWLAEQLPEQFPSIKDAENRLAFIHLANISRHENSVGQKYPFVVDAPMPTELAKEMWA